MILGTQTIREETVLWCELAASATCYLAAVMLRLSVQRLCAVAARLLVGSRSVSGPVVPLLHLVTVRR